MSDFTKNNFNLGFFFVFDCELFPSWTTTTKLLCFSNWWLCVIEKKKPKIRSRTKANSLISRRQLQPSFHEKFLLPIAHYHIITTTKKNNRLIPMILQHDIIFFFKKKTFKWAFVSLFCIYVHRIIAIYTWYLSSFLVEKCLATSVVWGNLGTTTTKTYITQYILHVSRIHKLLVMEWP